MSLFAAMVRRIAALERSVNQLRPSSAPGVRTSRTSRGVLRRPIAQTKVRPVKSDGVIVTFL